MLDLTNCIVFGSLVFSPGDVWLRHAGWIDFRPIPDALIAISYLTIAFTLVHIVRRHPQLGRLLSTVAVVFAAFLFTGGLMYGMGAVALWHPADAWSDPAHLTTAIISTGMALALIRALPTVLRLPGPRSDLAARGPATAGQDPVATLTAANEELRREAAHSREATADALKLNEALQAHVTELELLIEVLPVGIAIAADSSCQRLRSNEAFARMMGLATARDTSLSAQPFPAPSNVRFHHEGRELAPDEMPMTRAIARNSPVYDFEMTITRPDGGTHDVIANVVPMRDAEKKPRGCVATFQDISSRNQAERKRLDFERRLLQSQKLESIGVLAGGIAHDFNNLLTGVLGHANFARSELARGMTNIDHLLAQVESSALRAAELCRQLLAYAGKGHIVVRLIDFNVAVEQCVPLLHLSVTKKVRLDFQLGPGLPPLRGDPSQLNQLLLNLVTNAAEAIGPGAGTITISTSRVVLSAEDMATITPSPEMEPGTFICLTMRDTGCGIAPDTIAHIFEPFFTTKFVGRGLGLAAVIGIVHGHRGGIRVSSEVGAGSKFELFFPVVPAGTRGTSVPFAGPSHALGTVLVVDDNPAIRDFAATALGAAGYTVVTATDGESAIARLRADPVQFDAVLLDLTMPKLDGEDTLLALRMISPHLRIVLTSGYGDQAIAQRFVGRGLADFLPKPFVSEALVSVIAAAINRPEVAAA